MVSEVRRGASLRSVARKHQVSLSTVQYWVARARDKPLGRVDWEDRPHVARWTGRTPPEVEAKVLELRDWLCRESVLGEYGAESIHRELILRGMESPHPRTIHRILERHGALDGRRRIRRPAPPRGWYLPDLAAGLVEMDCADVVEGLVIRGGLGVEVLNLISVHGRLVASWPMSNVSARSVVASLIEHWRGFGLPRYAQFDNDTRFQGAHHFPDTVGRVSRLCLSLGIVPVFVPPYEHGFQAAIESYNGRWQQKVWSRFRHHGIPDLGRRSERYITAHRQRTASVRDATAERDRFPDSWRLDLQAHPQGRIVYLRRTNDSGDVRVLGRKLAVDRNWTHRLVRCEVDLDQGQITFYALRRARPDQQPVLGQVPYELPRRRFRG